MFVVDLDGSSEDELAEEEKKRQRTNKRDF